MDMQKKLVLICLLNFLIAALLGLALRYSFLDTLPINYRFLTHAHSHIAMLGWIYLMLYCLFVHYFVPEKKTVFKRLFWLTQFSVIGMMLSFPFQGYAAISISFSTLHIFCSYYFTYLIWKHQKIDFTPSRYLCKASLIFMLLSTLGVWCLGPAVSLQGNTSAFYQIAIQFFLHFQFNGWYLMAVLAVFFHLIKLKDSLEFRLFFKLLIVSTILTLALTVNWYAPSEWLYWINNLGVLIQCYAVYIFLKLLRPYISSGLNQKSKLNHHLLAFIIICFVLKSLLQLISLSPDFSQVMHVHRNLVIGFIHLTMLGLITGFLFFFLLNSKLIQEKRTLSIGIYTFFLGFVLTEILLMIQGGLLYFNRNSMEYYHMYLFTASMLIPIGIGLMILNVLRSKNT